MELITELCGLVIALCVVVLVGIGIKQEYLTWSYGEDFAEHVVYRRWTIAGYIISGIGSVAAVVYTIGLFI